MPKALVTGGAGFIGSHVTDLLVREGWSVRVIDDLSTGVAENLNPKATFIRGDLSDPATLETGVQDVDYVFHLAALPRIQPSFDEPLLHERVNVEATIALLERLRGHRIKKFVYSSSSACYGTPTIVPTPETAPIDCLSPYALQKHSAEMYVRLLSPRYGIPAISLRYFNVYGPRSFNPRNPQNAYTSVIGIFQHQKKAGLPLTITGDGTQSRDFVHVQDVARANLKAATSAIEGEVYNVGSGSRISIRDLAAKFRQATIHVPPRLGESLTTWADISKIQKDLGWRPTIPLDQGLETS